MSVFLNFHQGFSAYFQARGGGGHIAQHFQARGGGDGRGERVAILKIHYLKTISKKTRGQ